MVNTMLEPLLGSRDRERVLAFIFARGDGYARQIARFFESSLDPIQKQLDHLEAGSVLISRTAGRTRLYMFNPRYPFLKQLEALMEQVLVFYPEKEREALVKDRRRPRRRAKPS